MQQGLPLKAMYTMCYQSRPHACVAVIFAVFATLYSQSSRVEASHVIVGDTLISSTRVRGVCFACRKHICHDE